MPVKGSKREGELHIKAYTRDAEWVLLKSWIEDEEMIIEVKRRIDLDYLMNSNSEALHDIQKGSAIKISFNIFLFFLNISHTQRLIE